MGLFLRVSDDGPGTGLSYRAFVVTEAIQDRDPRRMTVFRVVTQLREDHAPVGITRTVIPAAARALAIQPEAELRECAPLFLYDASPARPMAATGPRCWLPRVLPLIG